MHEFVFNIKPMEIGPQFRVSFNRLEEPGIELVTPEYKVSGFIHHTMVAPDNQLHTCCRNVDQDQLKTG